MIFISFLLQTSTEWQDVFILAGVIHLGGVIFYGIYASGELQPWAEPPKDEQLQLEETQLPPATQPPAYDYIYQDGRQQPGWNDTTTTSTYPTWDDGTVGGGGGGGVSTNPFGTGTAPNYDPNQAWDQSNNNNYQTTTTTTTNTSNYGTMDNNNQATFYETRAQYVQPGSGY